MYTLFSYKQWNRYVECVNRPYAYRPPELRKYLYRWETNIKEDQKKYFDWMLSIDERSYLSQSIFALNKTESFLRNSQPNTALLYTENANEALQVNNVFLITSE